MQASNYREWPRCQSSPNRPALLADTVSVRPGENLLDIADYKTASPIVNLIRKIPPFRHKARKNKALPLEDMFLSLSKFFPCPLLKWPDLASDRQLNLDVVMNTDASRARSEFGALAWFDDDAAWISIYLGTYLRLSDFTDFVFQNKSFRSNMHLDEFPEEFIRGIKKWVTYCGCDWVILHEFGHISRGHGLSSGKPYFLDRTELNSLVSRVTAVAGGISKDQDNIDHEVAADFYAAKSFGECIYSKSFITIDFDKGTALSTLEKLPEHYTWIPAIIGACSTLAWLCYNNDENTDLYPSLEERLGIFAIGISSAASEAERYNEEQQEQFMMLPMTVAGFLGTAFNLIDDEKAKKVANIFKKIEQEDEWYSSLKTANSLIKSAGEKGLIMARFRRPSAPWSTLDSFF